MFRPKKMRKIRLIVLKSVVEKLVKELHETGIIDIRKTAYDGLDEGRPLQSFDEVSIELLKLRAALGTMEAVVGKSAKREPKPMERNKAILDAREFSTNAGIGEKLRGLNQSILEINEAIKSLESELQLVQRVKQFKGMDFSKLNTRTLGYKIGEVQPSKLPALENGLSKASPHIKVIADPESKIVLIVYDKKSEAAVESSLTDGGFGEFELPAAMTTSNEMNNRISAQVNENNRKLAGLKQEVRDISTKYLQTVQMLVAALEVESDRSEIASKFASSKRLYIIEGWMLDEDGSKLDSIVQRYGASIESQDVQYGHEEMPPTVLDNPKIANPIEFLTKSYSLPNYHEIDPTMVYLVALPFIYGMIVGDVMYGFMSAILATLIGRKFAKSYIMSNVSKIWLYSTIPTIIFGLLFDEWAGMGHMAFFNWIGGWVSIQLVSHAIYEPILHRMENILLLVGLSAFVGIVHLAIGFIIGAINEWNHNRKHAIAKLAWLGAELGIFFALLPFMPSLIPELGYVDPGMTLPAAILLVICIIIIGVLEGIIGIIEVPGLVGNILSYSRIAAVGVVGVIIAELLNKFIMPLPAQGWMALIMAPIFIVLHFLNCFVAMFESLVQGGRLNIVEFKSKFLHGGGDLFLPFALYSKKL